MVDAARASAIICELPYESRSFEAQAAAIATSVVVRVAVLLRLASRLWIQHRLFSDDYILILALVCLHSTLRITSHTRAR